MGVKEGRSIFLVVLAFLVPLVSSPGFALQMAGPDSGAVWVPGHTYEIRWDAGVDTDSEVDLYLLQDGERVDFDMDFSIDALIDRNEPNTGSYEWKIDRTSVPLGDDYQIELVTDEYGSVLSPPFSFGTDITFSAPDSGAVWVPGHTYEIRWDADVDTISSVGFYLLQDGERVNFRLTSEFASTDALIDDSEPNTGTYEWEIDQSGPYKVPPGDNYQIELKIRGYGLVLSPPFSIGTDITFSAPDSGAVWVPRHTYAIRWNLGVDTASMVDLYLLQDGERVDSNVSPHYVEGGALIDGAVRNADSYEWEIPRERYRVPLGDNYQIELESHRKGSVLSPPFSIGTNIVVSAPDSSAVWVPGHTYEIRWDAGVNTEDEVDLYLLQDGERVDFDMEGRGIDALIEIDEPNSGSYEWKIERASVPPGDNYQIELVGYGSGLSSPFSIGTDITFSVPDSGAVWVPGHTYEIRWDAGMDTADDVDLYLLQDGERVGFDMDTAIDALIDRNEPNTGIYEWGIERSGLYKVPPGDNYQIELVTSRYGSVLSPPFSFGTDIAFDFPSPEATPGDFDADGEITLSDALFTLQAALNKRELTLEQKAAADVNNDGDVTLVDALFILQAARGKRDLSAGVKPVVALEEFGEPVVLQGRFEPDGEGMIQLALSVPGRNAGALNLELSYDPEKLTWVDFENAEIERAILTEVEIPQPGTLRLMRVATGDGSGDLGRLRFQARPLTGGGEIQVAAFEYFNEHGQSLPTDARTRFDGRLRVLPTDFALHHNYPNPFNPGTAIHYDLPADGAKTVRLQIYNVLGQTIRTLVAERQEPGFYSVHWDGKDDRGASAASGLYFYRLQAGEQVLVRRMMLMR